MADTTNYDAEAGKLLTRGSFSAAALASGASHTEGVMTKDDDWLTVDGQLAAAGVAGDLTVTVEPYQNNDSTTLTTEAIAATTSVGPTKETDNASRFWGRYNVEGINRVRITWTNNNAAAKDVTGSWQLKGA